MAKEDTNPITVLAELARQVRKTTLQLLHVPDSTWLTWSPPGTSNHMLWHAGHSLWIQDALTIRPITGTSELPGGWEDTFGHQSQPASVTNWPEVGELIQLLEVQLARIVVLLTSRADTIIINATARPSKGGWPILAGMIHGWHDEARHQGEMYLLHKLCRIQER